jgi:formylglycine-generating enzyme required for sulfatase activity/serine/threonine protein kinase
MSNNESSDKLQPTSAKSEGQDHEAPTQGPGEAPTYLLGADSGSTGKSTGTSSSAVSQTLGPYLLFEKLGQGGMGSVYKAQHTKLKRVVAIKLLLPQAIGDAQAIARFEREMEAVGKIEHPNIVRAMDAGEFNGVHYLAMEYVEGNDLHQLVKKHGPMSLVNACKVIRQAAQGLAVAHDAGLVHRDIKPSNMLVAKDGKVKILDLGLARLSDGDTSVQGLTSTGQTFGTPDYMAPEQWDDSHQVDGRADLYALGCTLFFLLTGKPPFASAQSFGAKLKAHMVAPIPKLEEHRPDVPPELSHIYEQLMAKTPSDRIQSAQALAKRIAPLTSNKSSLTSAPVAALAPDSLLRESVGQPVLPSPHNPSNEITISLGPRRTALDRGRPDRGWFDRNKVAIACGGVFLPLLLLGIVLLLPAGKGTIRIETNDPAIEVLVREGGATIRKADKEEIQLTPGDRVFTIERGDLKFDTDKFVLKKGDVVTLRIDFLEKDFEAKLDGKPIGGITISKPSDKDKTPDPKLAEGGWHGWPADAPKPAIAPFDADQAEKHQKEWAAYLKVPIEWKNSIGMKFRLIPPGEFTMGSMDEEIQQALKLAVDPSWKLAIESERPAHQVILTKPFYLGVHEVTQRDYMTIVGRNPALYAKTGTDPQFVQRVADLDTANFPVDNVSWLEANQLTSQLSAHENYPAFYSKSGTRTATEFSGYRLPTEAEWEFACRAGTTTLYFFGNNPDPSVQAGWSAAHSENRPHAVAELPPNPFGLFDIHGNAWEWVEDWWDPNYYQQSEKKAAIDPQGPRIPHDHRVMRGGSWTHPSTSSRSSKRHYGVADRGFHDVGVRLVIPVGAVRQAIEARGIEDTETKKSSTGWHGWPVDAPKPAIAPFDAEQAKNHQKEWATYLKVPVEWENSIGMKFHLIPPGEFMMGHSQAENETLLPQIWQTELWLAYGRSSCPRHRVVLTQPIYLSKFEVTQGQYERIVGKNPSFYAASGAGSKAVEGINTLAHPVESVTWHDAVNFCVKLGSFEEESLTGSQRGAFASPGQIRLPTEAEWEYSCRAGTTTRFWPGDKDSDLASAAWVDAKVTGWSPHTVGGLKANPFGLCDMHGNVYEWVRDVWAPDYYATFSKASAIDPQGPTSVGPRVMRGGGIGDAVLAESALRAVSNEGDANMHLGFRVALMVDAVRRVIDARGGDATETKKNSTGWHGWPADAPKPAIAPFNSERAKQHQKQWADYLKVPVEHTNSIGMKFRLIPPGEYTRGSSASDVETAIQLDRQFNMTDSFWPGWIASESPVHTVVISQPFYLAVNETTQAEYQRVMGKNPSQFCSTGSKKDLVEGKDTSTFPVDNVSYDEAVEFLLQLDKQERANGNSSADLAASCRLPTEAEWEFACRAGTTTKYFNGDRDDELTKVGWCGTNPSKHPHPVGGLSANPFGLNDMHGNLWEWTRDWYDPGQYQAFTATAAIDPNGPDETRFQRSIRGGVWYDVAAFCRSATRSAAEPGRGYFHIGFRAMMSVDAVKASAANGPKK